MSAVVYTSTYYRPNHLNSKFCKVRLIFHNFKTTKTIESKLSKQTLVPQLCIHLDHNCV